MNILLISDLHLTAHPRDEYRWKIFSWVRETMQKNDIRYLYILGDLTEAKDYHSARLVNRVVQELLGVYRQTQCLGIEMLRGNHDGVDPNLSYFRFLGQYPSIRYVETPWMQKIGGKEILMLPHTTDPQKAWEHVEMHAADYIFMHATMAGTIAENGQQMSGVSQNLLRTARRAKIYSGDIHMPQVVGSVEYVGAPYPVRFGDDYEGRAVLINTAKGKQTSLPVPGIQRRYIDVYAEDDKKTNLDGLREGDQIKVRIHLSPHEALEWHRIKSDMQEFCAKHKIELCGIELVNAGKKEKSKRPKINPRNKTFDEVLDGYCKINQVGREVVSFGRDLLKEVVHAKGGES